MTNAISFTSLKRVFIILLSVVVAFALMPLPAYASYSSASAGASLTQGDSAAKAQSAVKEAQADTVAVYVLVRDASTIKQLYEEDDTDVFAYYNNGLLKSRTYYHHDQGHTRTVYGYDKRGYAVSAKVQRGWPGHFSTTATRAIKRSSKGLPLKEVFKSGSGGKAAATTTYAVKSGKVRSAREVYKSTTGAKRVSSASYAYKGGRVSVVKSVVSGGKSTTKYAYDSKGNMCKTKYNGLAWYSWKNAYDKHGLLAKRASTKFTYKKITIPKSMKQRVKAQQWALLNSNLNFVF